MITKLTKAQEQEMSKYVEKYTNVGLHIGKINKIVMAAFVSNLYKFLQKPNTNPKCLVMDGPIDAWIAVCLLESDSKNPSKSKLNKAVFDRISKKILQQTGIKVKNQIGPEIKNFVWPYLDGHYWASYIAWVKFYEYIGVKIAVDYSIVEES